MVTALPITAKSTCRLFLVAWIFSIGKALNKGTAFTEEERKEFGLHGLLPPHLETLDEQVVRAYEAYKRKDDDLERHIYLRALQDTNEVLFYRLLLDHIEEMTPMVYTPTVALACEQFSHIYRRARGLFISYPLRDSIPQLLRNRPNKDVDVIVVTDGERILGIGDQGAGGLGIPIGKLSLYTLIGGIRPERTLPIVLDVGTNNAERLKDPEYLGWRHERITGQAYFDFVDQFVQAVKQELPGTCLQWEDFATPHARPILNRYRDQLLTFNDDIQGTSAVALGAVLGAVKVTGKSLKQQQIVMLGAGSAGIGVADGLRAAMREEGLTEQEAQSRFWVIDKDGLLHSGRKELTLEQVVYARPENEIAGWPRTSDGQIGLADVIGKINATILIGLSTVGGAFSEPIVREMARKVERPIIFPLSNPTSKSEAKAEDLIQLDRWTRVGGVRFPVCSRQLRRPQDTHRAMQQHLHLPCNGTWRRSFRRSPGNRADDAGSGPSTCRKFAGAQGSIRVPASSPDGAQESGGGDCHSGWSRSTKEMASPQSSVRTNCVERVLKTQWTPAYTALE